MARTRRSFTTEYKVEDARRSTVRQMDQRRASPRGAAAVNGEAPLSAAERTELLRLRKQVAEQEKDLAFLKKASAYFAANQQR
ncbi:hypothetical protein OG921_20215 [Aldersonia sp. NBC_00410]|uniref:hypothetical protein n=1 Tax=Aldersonia sp. NBC_00410 TaxID=2975954 RepID=UPI002255CCB6|nr:hypothetical protein [Aldersonia sp. NBC_00410]MCX5045497.1 hypothetical protein [Aldersonia sp. NBC_00410]